MIIKKYSKLFHLIVRTSGSVSFGSFPLILAVALCAEDSVYLTYYRFKGSVRYEHCDHIYRKGESKGGCISYSYGPYLCLVGP